MLAADVDSELPHDLPTTLAGRQYCIALIDAMRRRGLLDKSFFRTLLTLRPRREAEIKALALRLGISWEDRQGKENHDPITLTNENLRPTPRGHSLTRFRTILAIVVTLSTAAVIFALTVWGPVSPAELQLAATPLVENPGVSASYRWSPDAESPVTPPHAEVTVELQRVLVSRRTQILGCVRRHSRLIFGTLPPESIDVDVFSDEEGWNISVRASRRVSLKRTTQCVKSALGSALSEAPPASSVIGVAATRHFDL